MPASDKVQLVDDCASEGIFVARLASPTSGLHTERSEKTGVWGSIPQEDRYQVFSGNPSESGSKTPL
jgi:hypothetical protein